MNGIEDVIERESQKRERFIFETTISKSGSTLLIRIPNALRPMAAPMLGRKVRVTVTEEETEEAGEVKA